MTPTPTDPAHGHRPQADGAGSGKAEPPQLGARNTGPSLPPRGDGPAPSPAEGARMRTAPSAGSSNEWGVFVDEVRILATRSDGADWWALYHSRQPQTRLTCLVMSIAGGHWHLGCDSEEDAGMLRDTMIERGINPKFVAVARLADCERTAGKRRTARQEQAAGGASVPVGGTSAQQAWQAAISANEAAKRNRRGARPKPATRAGMGWVRAPEPPRGAA